MNARLSNIASGLLGLSGIFIARLVQGIRGRRSKHVLCFCVLLCCSSVVRSNDLRLQWSNGDTLSGTIGGLEGDTLSWISPLFTKPVPISIQSLRLLSFPPAAGFVDVIEPFRAETVSGDIIYGNVAGIDQELVKLKSKRHGLVLIKRSQLVSLRRLNKSASIALEGLNGWTTLDPLENLDNWRLGFRGRAEASRWGAELYRTINLPDLAQIEVALSWSDLPGFVFSITQGDDVKDPESITIENWGDELVVVQDSNFESVERLSQTSGRIHLRIYVNRKAGEIIVCSYDGRELAKLRTKDTGAAQRGIYLRNKQGDIMVETLQVARWNGVLPKASGRDEKRLQLTDGTIINGLSNLSSAAGNSLTFEENGRLNKIPFEKIESVYFANPRSIPTFISQIAFLDGSIIQGTIESLSDTEATVRTSFSEESIRSRLQGCQDIYWARAAQTPPKDGDVLYWEGGRSHGSIASVTSNDYPLGWKPTGAQAAVPIDDGQAIRIARRNAKKPSLVAPDYNDAVFLTDLTALPCRIGEVTSDGALVVTPFNSEPVFIDNMMLKALEFGRLRAVEGFTDTRWLASDEQAIELGESDAVFTNAGKLTHPTALLGSEVRFRLVWSKETRAKVDFTFFSKREIGSGIKFSINFASGAIAASSSYLNITQNNRSRRASRVRSPSADFIVSLMNNQFLVMVNGEEVIKETLSGGRFGRGIEIDASSLLSTRGKPGGSFRMTNFTASTHSGDAAIKISDDTKLKLLSLPRLRSANPPSHIIAATNGDLLRGKLLSVKADTVNFQSKLRELRIPRDRIACVIWLGESKPILQQRPRFVLQNKRVLAMKPSNLEESHLSGESSILGSVTLPIDFIQEIQFGSYKPSVTFAPYEDWYVREIASP